MASLNTASRELVLKIVYYGPGLGGKTTTLQSLHEASPPERRGKLVSLATPVDRTLYFDFLPLRLPPIRGLAVRLQLFTVPGQVYFNATRRLVLSGADGIVFVADSQAERLDANLESLENLRENLSEHGRDLASLPHAFAFNKRDLADLLTLEELERALNRHGAPVFGTVATRGDGTLATLEEITRRVLVAYEAQLPVPSRPTPPAGFSMDESPSVEVRTPAPPPVRAQAPEDEAVVTSAKGAPPHAPGEADEVLTSAKAGGEGTFLADLDRIEENARRAAQSPEVADEVESVAGTRWDAESPAEVGPRTVGSRAAPLTLAPRAGLSFATLFSPVERPAVHEIEAALAHGAHTEALSACDTALVRMLAPVAALVGCGPLDPALPLLVGIDGRRFLSFRSLVRRARQRGGVGPRDALEAYAFVLEVRAALTHWETVRASNGASAPPPREPFAAPDSTPPLPPSSIAPPPL
ncbi:MAG: gliding motility protein [Myxococcales bacterium]|nr:gliding motility protein [Myxococcales bacterium]